MVDLSKHVNQDQIHLYSENLLHSLLCWSAYYTLSALNLVYSGTMISYWFFVHFFEDPKAALLGLWNDLGQILLLFKLNFLICLISLKSTINLLFMQDKTENMEQALQVYKRLKKPLSYFSMLPLSPHDSILAYLILKKVPNFAWQIFIPFPSFLFEDEFTKVPHNDEEERIVAVIPPPEPTTVTMVRSKKSLYNGRLSTDKSNTVRKTVGTKPVQTSTPVRTDSEVPSTKFEPE